MNEKVIDMATGELVDKPDENALILNQSKEVQNALDLYEELMEQKEYIEAQLDTWQKTYDNQIIETERLVVPHPDMMNRDFVLRPMTEIAPGFVHPVTGKTMGRMMVELHEKESTRPSKWWKR